MKTILVCFQNKYHNSTLSAEQTAIGLLNQYSVFPNQIVFLEENDADALRLILQNAENKIVFVNGAHLCTFDLSAVLDENQISVDLDGVFSGEKFVCLLGKDLDCSLMDKYVSAMQNCFNFYHDKVVFKSFGFEKEKIDAVTDQITQKYPCARFCTTETFLDARTVLIYDTNASKIEIDNAIKEFLIAFNTHVYAEDDVLLETRLNELLQLRRLSLSTAESMTGGLIASKVVSVKGASNHFYEGLVTYNTSAKEERLGVDHSAVVNYGVVSSEVCYQMADALLQTGKCDLSLSITGYATIPDQDDGGMCFIGVGSLDGVEVYKYEFSGTRTEVINKSANAALFILIKTISKL